MLIGLVSAKASPGVTTTALALSATQLSGSSDRVRVFCEFDPSGGDVECWTGRSGESGLLRVVGDLRRTTESDTLLAHAVDTPPKVRSILAPAGRREAAPTVDAATNLGLAAVWRAADTVVLLDAGRWSPDQPAARRLEGCEVLAVVCAPTVAGVQHASVLVDDLQARFDVPVVLILVGTASYPPEEIASTVGVPAAGLVAWDPRGVRILLSSGATRIWARTALARSAGGLLDRLMSLAEAPGASDSRVKERCDVSGVPRG